MSVRKHAEPEPLSKAGFLRCEPQTAEFFIVPWGLEGACCWDTQLVANISSPTGSQASVLPFAQWGNSLANSHICKVQEEVLSCQGSAEKKIGIIVSMFERGLQQEMKFM